MTVLVHIDSSGRIPPGETTGPLRLSGSGRWRRVRQWVALGAALLLLALLCGAAGGWVVVAVFG